MKLLTNEDNTITIRYDRIESVEIDHYKVNERYDSHRLVEIKCVCKLKITTYSGITITIKDIDETLCESYNRRYEKSLRTMSEELEKKQIEELRPLYEEIVKNIKELEDE